MFRRILLCYDATREGRRALREGADLARHYASQVHLLAVLEREPGQWGADVGFAMALDLAEQTANDVLREGVECLSGSGLVATGHFAVGNPVDVIARFVAELSPDLVVLGHHRRGAFARWWDGRDDRLLLDRVSCNVLVVPGPEVSAVEAPLHRAA
jgi:nucleotide-binding universal stress UspA family protein